MIAFDFQIFFFFFSFIFHFLILISFSFLFFYKQTSSHFYGFKFILILLISFWKKISKSYCEFKEIMGNRQTIFTDQELENYKVNYWPHFYLNISILLILFLNFHYLESNLSKRKRNIKVFLLNSFFFICFALFLYAN